jgi:hypothetical protein
LHVVVRTCLRYRVWEFMAWNEIRRLHGTTDAPAGARLIDLPSGIRGCPPLVIYGVGRPQWPRGTLWIPGLDDRTPEMDELCLLVSHVQGLRHWRDGLIDAEIDDRVIRVDRDMLLVSIWDDPGIDLRDNDQFCTDQEN